MRKEVRLKFLDDLEETVQRRMVALRMSPVEEEPRSFLAPSIYPMVFPQYAPRRTPSPSSSHGILYTRDKELIRTVAGRKLIHAFMNKKRAAVLEHLLEANGPHVPTTTLIFVSKSPNATALRKLIQGINTAARNKLKIKERLIVGRQGFGYAINANLSVIKA